MSSILEKKLSTQEIAKDFLIPFSVQGALLGAAGCVLTVPVIWIILNSNLKKLHPDLFMSGILCFNNLCISISLFFTSIFILCGYNAIVYNDTLCDIQVLTMTVPLLVNSYIIGLISIERCLLIVFNIKLSKIIYGVFTLLLYIIPYAFIFRGLTIDHTVISMAGVYGMSSPKMSTKFPLLGVYAVLGLASMATVIASYLCIFIFRLSHLNQNRQNLNVRKEEIIKQKLRITLKSILILFLFIFNHSGKIYVLITEVFFKSPRTFILDVVTENLIIYSTVTDVTLLLTMNNDIRLKFWKFFNLKNGE
jgi:mRNA-degrading endonuclease HigB of HigAB toxin-antitoxin module